MPAVTRAVFLALLPPAQHPTSGTCGDGAGLRWPFAPGALVQSPALQNQEGQEMSCLLCETSARIGRVKKQKDHLLEMNSFTPNGIILLLKEVEEEERFKQNCGIITQGPEYQDLQQEVQVFCIQQKVF